MPAQAEADGKNNPLAYPAGLEFVGGKHSQSGRHGAVSSVWGHVPETPAHGHPSDRAFGRFDFRGRYQTREVIGHEDQRFFPSISPPALFSPLDG